MTMIPASIWRLSGTDSSLALRLPAVTFAALLGAFLFYGVGFAPIDAAHNAAHDGRHVMAFPCH